MNTVLAPVHTRYETVFAGEDSGSKLLIKLHLDRKKQNVVFSCKSREDLSQYATREVEFKADFTCTLHFSNEQIFSNRILSPAQYVPKLTLTDRPASLFAVSPGDTNVSVTAMISPTEEIYTDSVKIPPIIHVP